MDADSYFASCEELLCPWLRGLPIGVVPVMVDSSCCIAASYAAKEFGVKTGTGVRDAHRLCPGIVLVKARPEQYVRIHHEMVTAVEACITIKQVLSIDELYCELPPKARTPDTALEIGRNIKRTVSLRIGQQIRVSVGIAPNKFLAKLASKLKKPDALHCITSDMLPDALFPLKLRDVTGIGSAMERRLHEVGIHSVKELCTARKSLLRAAWKSLLGEQMWYRLRGYDVPDSPVNTQHIGHSHVLAPDFRGPKEAWEVLCKLLHKACERLRHARYMTRELVIQIEYDKIPDGWSNAIHCDETDSTIKLFYLMRRLWRTRSRRDWPVVQVGVVLGKLTWRDNYTPPIFQETKSAADKHQRLDQAVDQLRGKFGRDKIYFGVVHGARDEAPMRIPFARAPDIAVEYG